MKKTYIIPEIEVVEINTHLQLLAGSNIDVDMGTGDVDPVIADAPEFDYEFDDNELDNEEFYNW